MTRPIDTIRLSRADTLLGATVSQQTSIDKRKVPQGLLATSKPGAPSHVESATQKPKPTHEQALDQASQTLRQANRKPGSDVRSVNNTRSAINSPYSSHQAGAEPARSAQPVLTAAGKLLQRVLTQYPEGAGPIKGDKPLFVSAVMLLRANALARSGVHAQEPPSDSASGKSGTAMANSTTVPTPTTASGQTASSALSTALMQVLQSAITQSGLFYEAQVARALLGNRIEDLDLLREQPQSVANRPEPEEETSWWQALKGKEESEKPEERFHATVRRQIEVLNSHTIQWQGQPWPQSNMNWVIHPAWVQSDNPWSDDHGQPERESSENKSEQALRPWCSTLSLQLPTLGTVKVHLWILGQQAKIQIETQSHRETLDAHLGVLNERLGQAGIQALSLQTSSVNNDVNSPDSGNQSGTGLGKGDV